MILRIFFQISVDFLFFLSKTKLLISLYFKHCLQNFELELQNIIKAYRILAGYIIQLNMNYKN